MFVRVLVLETLERAEGMLGCWAAKFCLWRTSQRAQPRRGEPGLGARMPNRVWDGGLF